MYVIVAPIQIKPEHREEFIEAMLLDAKGSVENEPDCLRFDVIQDQEDPNRIYLYEVYKDRAAFEYHVTTPHLKKWRETVKEWFVEPRPPTGRGTNIFPPDDEWK